jgi:hypothetical protein
MSHSISSLQAVAATLLGLTTGLFGYSRQLAAQADARNSVERQMAGPITAGPHLILTTPRIPTAAGSSRAAAIVDTLKRAIAKYTDVHAAEADGFRLFAPRVKNQPVFHYTRWLSAARAAYRFDPARPTSLLYRREANGSLHLIGAMYTAPQRSTLVELDRRVPLSIARWHLHTNLCIPPLGQRERWKETRDGAPLFGPASPIATEAACDAVGGRFLPKLFGWMVHVNVFENDPASIWAMPHEHHHAG